MSKVSIVFVAFLIIGLLVATTACNTAKATNVNTASDNNNVNAAVDNGNANVAPSNNDVKTETTNNKVMSIKDIKHIELLGKTVTVHGIVVNNVKLGRISGYRLNDSIDSIPISSQILPKVNSTVTVTGTLSNDSFFGYFIVANEQ